MTLSDKLESLGINFEPKRPKPPRVVDDDEGIISVMLKDDELRGWCYANDDERRAKMLQAREYVEGWCDAMEKIFSALDALMKPGASEDVKH